MRRSRVGPDRADRAGPERVEHGRGFRLVKSAMLVTDVAFLVYWTASLLTLIPARHAYKDFDDPVMSDWNYSFLPLDVAASATGLAALYLLRGSGGERSGHHRASWRSLMLVSLTLTSTAGLQAVVFWALRGDWSVTWWVPNLFLLLFPIPSIVLLMRQDTVRAGPDVAGAAVTVAPPGLQSRR
ncbi:YvaD family protein [Streptomyces sp. Tu 2975]|uniref:DUF5360 family protein n=1 Tax=Streptomyces sp. Tu 2975 TaxID=2676871 RepID=UPI0013598138|nr:DUF5360 family protein [Streptomyces sp. Tu 2975]QIP87287.1 YvaD family protein [Streptomyces sp. Tu 2975]